MERAFLADQEGGALDAHVLFPIHALLFPDAVVFGSFVLCVGKQSKRQIEFAFELGLGRGLVGRNAHDHGVFLGELFGLIAELAGFLGAAWCVGLGVEIQDNVL